MSTKQQDKELLEAQEEVASAVHNSVDAADTDSACEAVVCCEYLKLTGKEHNFDAGMPDFSTVKAQPDDVGALLIAKATLILAVETRRLRWAQEERRDEGE